MSVLFAIAAIIALIATAVAITRVNVVHALLYLVVSLLAVAVAIFALGAPYLAALEVIIYAGAIMVLFVFVTMMLNLGDAATRQERQWQPGRGWIGPGILAILLLLALLRTLFWARPLQPAHTIGPAAVGATLLGPYIVAVELASMLLMGAVVAAYHLGSGLLKSK
jgi:NADH-quinone oxidoreductase subunit J